MCWSLEMESLGDMYPSLLSAALVNTTTQTNLEGGGKGLFYLKTPRQQCITEEVRTGAHTGQEPGARSACRGHWGVRLPGLLSLLAYRTQDHHPKGGSTRNGLCPLPSITN